MYPRFLQPNIDALLAHMPVVAIVGPRQSGKTTLAQAIIKARRKERWRYVTLDNALSREAARSDPIGFIRGDESLAIDEIQRAPDLMLAIKESVDRDRRPGRFLLTGSADIRTAPKIQESLAGRMAITTLLPVAQAEMQGKSPPLLLTRLFSGDGPSSKAAASGDVINMALAGGFPDAIARGETPARRTWLRAYAAAIVEQDLPDIADIQRREDVPRLLNALAATSGTLLNIDARARDLGMSRGATARYIQVLEQLWVVRRVPAWHRNSLNRIVKSSKIHFVDTGLLAALRRLDRDRIARDRTLVGPLLEGWAYSELAKLASWSEERIDIMHYRDRDQVEVDLVLENEGGDVAGIEVKASATVFAADFAGLATLRRQAADAFRAGVILYDGDQVVPFGDRLWAAPFSVLWR